VTIPGVISGSRMSRYLIGFLIVLALALALWLAHTFSTPQRPFRIGFANSPPYHFLEPDGKPTGAAYEIVSEAAKRAGVALRWIYCPEDSEAALRAGKVDLWPMMGDFPDRREFFYISDPWIGGDYFILAPPGAKKLTRDSTVRIGYSSGTVRARLIKKVFPRATPVQLEEMATVVAAVCSGGVGAGIFEAGESKEALETRLPDCEGRQLWGYPIAGLRVDFGIGATDQTRTSADRIQTEIQTLAREGFLLSTLAKYAIFDAGDIGATYRLMQLEERERALRWGVFSLGLGFGLTLLLCWFLYSAKRAVARADTEKAESVVRFTLATRAANDVIWDWNPTTGVMTWSELAQSLFGYSASEIGEDMAWRNEHIHPDDCQAVIDAMNRALADGRTTWSAEYRFLRRNGKYARVMDRGCLVYGDAKKPLRVVGAMSDITHQRLLEDQLVQSQKMEAIGRLAGGVAHDFNNLLTVIDGYCQLLLNVTVQDSPARGYAAKIQKAARSAASLTQQLLAFSRRQIIEPSAVDFNGVLLEAEGMIQRLVGEDIKTVFVYNAREGMVLAEVNQLHQVLMNLTANARDAMPEGGKLIFELSNVEVEPSYIEDHPGMKPGSYVLLAVSDTGTGMDEETRSHIFEPFYTTKRKGVGTGLGLSTVHGIIEQNGGWIRVYSEPGKGSTFKIYLPRVTVASRVCATPEPRQADQRGIETILIVEDHPDVRKLASDVLRSQGYQVLEAPTAEEALATSRNLAAAIHLMLTDVVLPGMSGHELAERITSDRPATKILYMSGYTENAIVHRGILLPGIAFLAKPFSPQALLDKIGDMLSHAVKQ
jgi:PAS domain S-box-containing protein